MEKQKFNLYDRKDLFICMMTHFKQDTFKYFNRAIDLIEGNSEPEVTSSETEINPDNQD